MACSIALGCAAEGGEDDIDALVDGDASGRASVSAPGLGELSEIGFDRAHVSFYPNGLDMAVELSGTGISPSDPDASIHVACTVRSPMPSQLGASRAPMAIASGSCELWDSGARDAALGIIVENIAGSIDLTEPAVVIELDGEALAQSWPTGEERPSYGRTTLSFVGELAGTED